MSWNRCVVDGPFDFAGEAGYHLNIAAEALPESAVGAVIHPVSPNVVWSGDDPANPVTTVFLLFADESDARACLPALWIEEGP